MQVSFVVAVVLVLTGISFFVGRARALSQVTGRVRDLHSLPGHYGYHVAIWCGIPALLLVLAWIFLQDTVVQSLVVARLPADLKSVGDAELGLLINDIRNLAVGNIVSREIDPALREAANRYSSLRSMAVLAMAVIALATSIAGATMAYRSINPRFRAREHVERVVTVFLVASSTIAIFTTIGIVLSLLFESIRFFGKVPATEFLFGLEWSPQTALRTDQVGSSGAFGAVPLFAGTMLITAIAMAVAVPIGLLSAIYLSEYAPRHVRGWVKPLLEILAGVPTVVYGFFAALTVAPFFRRAGEQLGLTVSSESALAAGLVMGIMIIPFVSSLSDDVINAVPQSLRDGAYALGATRSETIKQVILPAALPGIVGSVMLAISRAIGETMIVVMAAGLSANLTANPFESVTTVTVQIVTLLVGDQEFDSAKTLAAFALGLVMFGVTLVLNVIALSVVRKYREQYD
jgi:phosphate transport system permease protein